MRAFCAVFAVAFYVVGSEASAENSPKIQTAQICFGPSADVTLTGHVYRQFSGKSRLYCGTMCTRYAERYLSINYCSGTKSCTLNSGNSVKYPQDMTTTEGCSYYDILAECDTVVTGNVAFQYHPLVVNVERIAFSIKASRNVFLRLSPQPADATDMYEIIIGGEKNQRVFLRKCTPDRPFGNCRQHVNKVVLNLLSPDEFRGFWLSFDVATGRLAVGREGEQAAFAEWVDPDPVNVTYIGFRNLLGETVNFRYLCSI